MINLAITLWIMTVLDFSTVSICINVMTIFELQDGIGALKIEKDGIKVQGRSEFAKPVQFSQISTDDVRKQCYVAAVIAYAI